MADNFPKLSECPFCGDDMSNIGQADSDSYFAKCYSRLELAVECGGCRAVGPFRADRASAIAAWNTRAPTNHDDYDEAASPVNYDYQEAMRVMRGCACTACGGTGEKNDAEPGDISFQSWVCASCDGKGWDAAKYNEAFPRMIAADKRDIEAAKEVGLL